MKNLSKRLICAGGCCHPRSECLCIRANILLCDMSSSALTDGIGFVLTKFPRALYIVNVQPHRNNRAHQFFHDLRRHFIAGLWGLGQKLVLKMCRLATK